MTQIVHELKNDKIYFVETIEITKFFFFPSSTRQAHKWNFYFTFLCIDLFEANDSSYASNR